MKNSPIYATMKVVIDVNIWISFGIGRELSTLPKLLTHHDIQIFSCSELTDELEIVCKYPKLQKYLSNERIEEIFELIARLTITQTIKIRNANFSDSKDNYLLNLSEILYKLIPQQIFKLIPSPYQLRFAIFYHHFSRLVS